MAKTIKARVLETANMDESVRPQDDYYRYINGTWLQDHQIPSDRPADGAFSALRDLSEEQCLEIAKLAQSGEITGNDAELIATLFTQFMAEDELEALGASPLKPFLEAVNSASDHRALASVAGKLERTGIGVFFAAGISTDLNDSTRYMLYLEQAGLGLPDESYYREDKYADIRAQYLEYLEKVFTLAEVGGEAEAKIVFDFETRLAALHWDIVKVRDIELQNNPSTWSDLVAANPGFAWEDWAQSLRLPLDKLGDINISQPDYLQAASQLWSETPLETLRLWYARKIIGASASYLSSDFVQAQFDFYSRALAGTEELRARWKRGVGLVEGTVGEALGKLYVQRHFPPANKARMDHLVEQLIAAYHDSISNLSWMSEETKAQALKKLASFRPKIAYPDKWRDYSNLEISANATLLDNVLAARAFETDRELGRLGTEVDRDEWFMTPQTVNAYYNPLMNEIVFPAAILQPPFFDPEADDAVNYGAIGAVIGHEIGHGFDDQGSQFDASGELRNWWTEDDRQEFNQRTQALIEQYNAFSPADLPDDATVNGALTVGENIGDLGGLTIAWKAWIKELEDKGIALDDVEDIDGLTGPERFFASWARIWRTKNRPEYATQLLAVDPHSPPEFRCNGVLANFDQFADVFEVKPGDTLWIDPQDRVHIW